MPDYKCTCGYRDDEKVKCPKCGKLLEAFIEPKPKVEKKAEPKKKK